MRDGSELVGWGMATGVWEALQMPIGRPHRADRERHAEVSCAAPISAPAPTRSWRRSRPTCSGLPIDNISVKLGDSTLPQSPVEGGSWMAASVSHAIATTAEEVRKELLRSGEEDAGLAARGRKLEDVVLADGKLVSKQDASRAVSIATRCGTARDRIEQEETNSFPE
jgi:xanthine dehydrogenase YagR molybdenum-binding subunit